MESTIGPPIPRARAQDAPADGDEERAVVDEACAARATQKAALATLALLRVAEADESEAAAAALPPGDRSEVVVEVCASLRSAFATPRGVDDGDAPATLAPPPSGELARRSLLLPCPWVAATPRPP